MEPRILLDVNSNTLIHICAGDIIALTVFRLLSNDRIAKTCFEDEYPEVEKYCIALDLEINNRVVYAYFGKGQRFSYVNNSAQYQLTSTINHANAKMTALKLSSDARIALTEHCTSEWRLTSENKALFWQPPHRNQSVETPRIVCLRPVKDNEEILVDYNTITFAYGEYGSPNPLSFTDKSPRNSVSAQCTSCCFGIFGTMPFNYII